MKILLIVLLAFIILLFFIVKSKSDGKIISIEPFIPHNYESLDENFRNYINKEKYQQYVQWYNSLKDIEFLKVIYLSDGLKVVGILAKPKHLENKKYPVVIYNRGGSDDIFKISVHNLKDDFYFLVKNGYIVIASQYRGNDGSEGKDELGGSDVNDVVNLFKVIKNLGYIDIKNIFIYGHSRGGMMATMALRKKTSVKAVAITSGVFDYFIIEKYRPDLLPLFEKMIPNFKNNKENEYIKRSATYWAQDINVPILLLHCKDDKGIAFENSEKMADELKKNSKEYDFVSYETGGHFLEGHQEEVRQIILDWFTKYA